MLEGEREGATDDHLKEYEELMKEKTKELEHLKMK